MPALILEVKLIFLQFQNLVLPNRYIYILAHFKNLVYKI